MVQAHDRDEPNPKKRFEVAIEAITDKIELAKTFIKLQPLFYDRSKNFWLWDFDLFSWEIVDQTDILVRLKNCSRADTISQKQKNEILESLKQVGRENHPKEIPKAWVQFRDKIVDIESGEMINASPYYFCTNPIPHSLGEHKGTPVIDKIFEEWVGPNHIKTLKQIIAYCMIPDYPIHRIFCLLGVGRNGKSRYLALINNIIGLENSCSVDLDSLMMSRFEAFSLYKKLVCIMGETNFSTMSRTAKLKQLSGQDLYSFEQKGRDSLHDINYAKLIIATNNLPETSDKSEGFYRRWILIDFPNTFPEGKDILKTIPKEEYSNFCLQCIDLLKDLLEEGKFYGEGTIAHKQKDYELRSDPLEPFLDEFIQSDYDSFIYKHEFKSRIKDWCRDNNYREVSETRIAKKMKELNIETKRKEADWQNEDGSRPRLNSWVGIRWSSHNAIKEEVQNLLNNNKV